MKKILFAFALLLSGYTGLAQQTDKLLDHYLAVKDALVSGSSEAVGQAAAAFQKALQAEAAFAGKESLLKAVQTTATAGDMEKQRQHFAGVSASFWKLVKQADNIQGDIYYQYCPMKKAYWLSREKTIRNPYYGSSMLSCGKVAETRK